jgi:hypothetical protein
MKNNMDNNFGKKLVLWGGLTLGVIMQVLAGNPDKPIENANADATTTKTTTPKNIATPKDTVSVIDSIVGPTEEQLVQEFKDLSVQTTAFDGEQRHMQANVIAAITDFQARLKFVLEKKGYKIPVQSPAEINKRTVELTKPHKQQRATMVDVMYLPQQLADSAHAIGEQYVNRQDITSKKSVDALLGILLSQNGPFGTESGYFTELLQGSVGSTVHGDYFHTSDTAVLNLEDSLVVQRKDGGDTLPKKTPGTTVGSHTEDASMREALQNDLRAVVELTLAQVKADAQNAQAQKSLKGVKEAYLGKTSGERASK